MTRPDHTLCEIELLRAQAQAATWETAYRAMSDLATEPVRRAVLNLAGNTDREQILRFLSVVAEALEKMEATVERSIGAGS